MSVCARDTPDEQPQQQEQEGGEQEDAVWLGDALPGGGLVEGGEQLGAAQLRGGKSSNRMVDPNKS